MRKNNKKKELFWLKLAEFLYTIGSTIQIVFLPKIFDKVVDGFEYRLIKYKHFIQIIKRKGLCLSYNDEQCIKDLIQEVFPNTINILALENLFKNLGIEDEKPVQSYNYSEIPGPVIRIFNKINYILENQGFKDILDFLGEENWKPMDIQENHKNPDQDSPNIILIIDPVTLRKIMAKHKIVRIPKIINI